MKVSLDWLKRYLNLDDAADKLEQIFPLIGFDVEEVIHCGLPPMDKVVVGEVTAIAKHPGADKLTVCEVRVSSGGKPQHIVCGASNFKTGDRVPVALPGAKLPGGYKIKKSKIRGIASDGMMCSPGELGLGEDQEGLLILDGKPEIGTPIHEVFPGQDCVYDLDVTPNRPDCLSHIGIARELAAYLRIDFSYPKTNPIPNGPSDKQPLIDNLSVKTPKNCPHYLAYSIKGVKIGPSPDWMQSLLKAVGLRPINNVVDVTNFVVHELGQPLHAFDAKKIRGQRIIVRPARKGETITTLDDKKRVLDPEMTVIADAERALVIGGVMGSIDAEVNEGTTDIVLESAYFNPANIRSTSRRLALSTDSSFRFERGADPNGTEFAALRAIDLIIETAGGELACPPLVEGKPPLREVKIKITPDYIRGVLGFPVEDSEIREVLNALKLKVSDHDEGQNGESWSVSVPSFRGDLDRPIDLVEEFLRIYGCDKIPSTTVIMPGLLSNDDPVAVFNRQVSAYLVGQHFHECNHYSMRAEAEMRQWFSDSTADSLSLDNPLTTEQTHLRGSLLPGLLDALRFNQSHRNNPRRLFECGHVFRSHDGKVWEMISAGFVLAQGLESQDWLAREAPDFFTALNLVNNLLSLAGVAAENLSYLPVRDIKPWQNGHAALAEGFENGYEVELGLLDRSILKAWDIEGAVLAGAIYLSPEFLKRPADRKRYRPFSSFPLSTKDLALVVDSETLAEQVRRELQDTARKAAGDSFAVESVCVFDVYAGKGLPEGKKSIAFSLIFRAPDRTLTDTEVNKVFANIQKGITSGTGYEVRS